MCLWPCLKTGKHLKSRTLTPIQNIWLCDLMDKVWGSIFDPRNKNKAPSGNSSIGWPKRNPQNQSKELKQGLEQ